MKIISKKLLRFTTFIFLIVLVFACSSKKYKLVAPKINSNYAMKLLKEGASIKPRHSGSKGAKETVKFINKYLKVLNVKYLNQAWTGNTPDGPIEFTNVIAEIDGQSKDKFIIIGCHFDGKKLFSVPDFEAANDGASGVAVLLSMIKAIKNSEIKPLLSIKFLFFDGEECIINYTRSDGLYGSRYYADQLEKADQLKNCRAVIILDMIGDRDLNITLPSGSDKNILKLLFEIVKKKQYSKYFTKYKSDIIDDHTPFQIRGIPVMDVIDFHYGDGNRFWHTAADTVDKTSEKSLAITGDTILQLIYQLKP
jgi:glutaminyl-peptide cyclotransferase